MVIKPEAEPEKMLHDPCGGVTCLDFANTLSRSVAGPDEETLHSFDDLLTWTAQAGLLPRERVRELRTAGWRRPEAALAVLARARELREAIYRIFAADLQGQGTDRADLNLLNAELAAAMGQARVEVSPAGFSWGFASEPGRLEAPLCPIVRSAADLLTSPERERVKECASETCLWLYLDRTKNRGRRWCEMKTCGNRAKVRAHRRRKSAGN